jgi:hypothetical protein
MSAVDKPRCGIIYYARGEQYVRMASVSAASAKKVMPDIPVKLYTTSPIETNGVFDAVCLVPDDGPFYSGKLRAFAGEREFDRFVFMDADTLVLKSIEHVFEILDRFDLAAAHEPYRVGAEFDQPQAFEELNTGVVFIKRSEGTRKLIADWVRHHEAMAQGNKSFGDQKSLRPALYGSALNIWVLTPEYNFRTCYPGFIGYNSPVYVMHGPQSRELGLRLNASNEFRVFLNSWSQVNEHTFGFTSLRSDKWFRLLCRVRKLMRGDWTT